MAVTFKDVARLAGVSTQTVSRVTNGADNVAEETRKRVNEAIKKLGYVPNKSAQMLSRTKSRVIGIVSLDISLHGVALIANDIRKQAHNMGYATAIAMSQNNSIEEFRTAIRELISQQVDAIIVNVPVTQSMAEGLVEQFNHVTFMFIDVPKEAKVNRISSDHQAGAALAVLHLIEQKHKAFLCISGPKESTTSTIRCREWQAQLKLHGLKEIAVYEGNWQAQSGYRAIKNACAKGIIFDAVLVANDQMALGVLCALAEAGISVPKSVSVIGFDGIQDSQFFSPPLTTIKQNFKELSQRAVKVVLKQLEKKDGHVSEMIPVEIVIRQSTEKKIDYEYDKEKVLKYLECIRSLLP